jgi:quercetin dioxygenase-like cupin family protein
VTQQSTSYSLSDHLGQIVPNETGKRSQILIKSNEMRVVLIRMRAGGDLREHSAPGQITLHALSGRFSVTVGSEQYELIPDSLIAIERDVRHSVECEEDGAFLLTIAWPHGVDAISTGEA